MLKSKFPNINKEFDIQLMNAFGPISVTDEGIVICCKDVQPANPLQSILTAN